MVWRNQLLTVHENVLKLTKDINANYLYDNSGKRFLSVGDAVAFLEKQNDDVYKDNIYFVQSSRNNRTYVIFFFPDGGNEEAKEAIWVSVNGRIHDLVHPMLTPEGNVVNRKYTGWVKCPLSVEIARTIPNVFKYYSNDNKPLDNILIHLNKHKKYFDDQKCIPSIRDVYTKQYFVVLTRYGSFLIFHYPTYEWHYIVRQKLLDDIVQFKTNSIFYGGRLWFTLDQILSVDIVGE